MWQRPGSVPWHSAQGRKRKTGRTKQATNKWRKRSSRAQLSLSSHKSSSPSVGFVYHLSSLLNSAQDLIWSWRWGLKSGGLIPGGYKKPDLMSLLWPHVPSVFLLGTSGFPHSSLLWWKPPQSLLKFGLFWFRAWMSSRVYLHASVSVKLRLLLKLYISICKFRRQPMCNLAILLFSQLMKRDYL